VGGRELQKERLEEAKRWKGATQIIRAGRVNGGSRIRI
jgi:hypothetical protein